MPRHGLLARQIHADKPTDHPPDHVSDKFHDGRPFPGIEDPHRLSQAGAGNYG